MGEFPFYEQRMKKIPRWSHLLELYRLEVEGLVKMSKLTEASVCPKPIDRQNVATCLRVFSEETYTGNHSGMRNIDRSEHTAPIIKTAVNWWKILMLRVKTGLTINYKLCYKTLL